MQSRRTLPLEIALLITGVAFVLPCGLAVLNALKTLPEIIESPLAPPETLNLDNFRYIFSEVAILRPMLNSLLMTVSVIAGLVALAPMTAYSLVRRRMMTGPIIEALLLAGITIPFQIIIVPLLQEFKMLGIDRTYLALWLHYVSWGLPLCVFIYSRFLKTIPRELEEAASIDGCGPIRTFWQIVFPLLKPCTASIIIFWGLWIWNDFVQAYVFMGGDRADLAFVQMYKFISDKYVKNWNYIFAGVVVLSAPVTILYLGMQRFFVKGLTAGSLK